MKKTDIDKLAPGTAVLVGSRSEYATLRLARLTGKVEQRKTGWSWDKRIAPNWEVRLDAYHDPGTPYKWVQSREIHRVVEDPEAWIAEQEASAARQERRSLRGREIRERRLALAERLGKYGPGPVADVKEGDIDWDGEEWPPSDDEAFVVHVRMSPSQAEAWLAGDGATVRLTMTVGQAKAWLAEHGEA